MKSYTFTIGEKNYQERECLNDFGVDEEGTLNNALFDVLFQFQYISRSSNMEKIILDLFNKAYYICSLILFEPRPYFNLQNYKNYAGKLENDIFDADKYVIVMSMVSVYLSTLDKINKDIERTINVIKSDLSKYSGSEYRKISAVCSGRAGETKATQFSLTQVHVKEVEPDQLTNCLIRNIINLDAPNKLNVSFVKNNKNNSININEQEELLNNENDEIVKLKKSIVLLKKQVDQLAREKAEIEKQYRASREKKEELRSENEKNKTECQRLLQLNGELEKQLHDDVIHSGDIIIAEDRKIDVIKVLHAMCKINLFRLKNGKKFTIKAVMEYFGKVLNDNFNEYNSNLSTSKAKTKEYTFLEVFDELRAEANKYLKKS